jgi:hypothetical protein
MSTFDNFLQHLLLPQTIVPFGIVFGLGVFALIARWVTSSGVKTDIKSNDLRFGDAFRNAETRAPAMTAAERLFIPAATEVVRMPLRQSDQFPEWVSQGSISRLYEEACCTAAQGRLWFPQVLTGCGRSLTGIALVLTFGLIAWVLATDVPRAIAGVTVTGDPSSSAAANEALQTAVAAIGAKFFVSATGLLLSLFFRALEAKTDGDIAELARRSAYRHRHLFTTYEQFRHAEVLQLLREANNAAEQSVERLLVSVDGLQVATSESSKSIVAATQSQTSELVRGLDGLSSIEVSVKDMGQEVSTHLGHVMKNQVADQICGALADLRGFAQEIVEQAQSESRTAHLSLLGALNQVETTIANQSTSDIEKLLERMQGAVATGYDNEARNLSTAIAALTRALPTLEEHLRRMTHDLEQQMHERTASAARLQADIVGELQRMISVNHEHMSAMRETNANLLTTAETAIGGLTNRIETLGNELHKRVLDSSEQTLNRLTAASETQVKRLAADVEAQAQQRAMRDAETRDLIFSELRSMAQENRHHMSNLAETSERVLAAAAESATRMTQHAERLTGDLQDRIVASGQNTISALASASISGVESVKTELADITASTTAAVERFGRSASQAEQALASARDSLIKSIEGLGAATLSMRQDLDRSAQVGRAAQSALESFAQASRSIESASTSFDRSAASLVARVAAEQSLLTQQREIAEQVLPVAIERYAKTLQGQIEVLETTWSRLAQSVQRTVTGAGDNLAQNVEDLTGEVQAFRGAVAALEKSLQGRR